MISARNPMTRLSTNDSGQKRVKITITSCTKRKNALLRQTRSMEQNARCEKRDIFAQIVKIESRLEHLPFLSALPGAFPRKFFNAG